jgi:hypothetical protein
MMHGRGKSDPAIVAVKPANKAERSVAEPVEPRAGGQGECEPAKHGPDPEPGKRGTGAERIRQAARERKKELFTALLHHVSTSRRRSASSSRTRLPGWTG